MRGLCLRLWMALLMVLAVGNQADAKTEEMNLSVGEEVTIENVREYGVENPQVLAASASRDTKSLVLRGLRSGNTKVIVRDAKGESRTLDVTVAARDPKLVLQEMDGLLRNYPDVTLRVSRNLVVLEGGVKSERELAQIKEIERRYEGQVSNLVTVGPSGGRRNVMVRLDLHYVQVRRRLHRQLGMNIPANISPLGILQLLKVFPMGGTDSNGGPVTQQSLLSGLMPTLDISETSGYVKLKRNDSLLTENGAKATYREGSEVMVRLQGTLGAGVLEKIFFGAELSVTPRLSPSNDAVSLELEADISQRDDAGGTDGLPAKLLDRLYTNVHVPLGQSIMLTAADLRSEARKTSGIPWLNRIPVLGYLFGSEGKDAESAYSVLFITPTLVQGNKGVSGEQIEQALRYFEKPGSLPR